MSDKWIKILCGKLYTGLEARFLEHAEILVHGQYIEEVGSNLPCPEGTEILDLSHLTVTPGMIDAHMHPEFFNWRDVYSDTIYNSDGYRPSFRLHNIFHLHHLSPLYPTAFLNYTVFSCL